MFEEFWKSLGGSFDQQWLIQAFGPALVFWGGGLWTWAQVYGLKRALDLWSAYAQQYGTEGQVLLGAGGLLVVIFTAFLLEAFEGRLLRLYEGYWPWPLRKVRRAVSQRRARRLEEKQKARQALRTKLVTGEATWQDRADLARLDGELDHDRPRDPDRSMPTALGDILRAAEDYPRARYGLEPIALWPRLFPHLGDALRGALGAAQDQLDLMLRMATLLAVHGVVWGVVAVLRLGQGLVYGTLGMLSANRALLSGGGAIVRRGGDGLLWALPALPLAYFMWRAAHRAARAYGGLFRSAFDLHRFAVYEAMRWPLPDSPPAERTQGERLTLYLLDGAGAEGVVYASGGGGEEG